MDLFKHQPSADRLWALITERLRPETDRAALDRHIWDLFGETWAVMYTDLVGFSRKVEAFGIVHFLQVILEAKRLFLPEVERHDGLMLKEEGDSLLIIFRQPVAALQCGFAMQRTARAYNSGAADEDRVELCLGLGYGRVLRIGDSDVFGPEVNAACKLGEDHARSGEILLTAEMYDALADAGQDLLVEPLTAQIPGSDRGFRLDWEA